jgi:hypothetical protein
LPKLPGRAAKAAVENRKNFVRHSIGGFMQKRLFIICLCFASLLLVNITARQGFAGQATSRPIPQELRNLTGTYVGEWAMFGVDENGQVVRKASWTDTIKVGSPTIKGDRAVVTTDDEMIFAGGKIPPRRFQGSEGYFTRMHKLADEIWAYGMPAAAPEIAQLGFTNVRSAQHVLIKVVTSENGTETHRITRVTTVNWKDKQGKEICTQFVSLQGYHKRQGS